MHGLGTERRVAELDLNCTDWLFIMADLRKVTKPGTAKDEQTLTRLKEDGKTLREIAPRLGRTEASCDGRFRKLMRDQPNE